MPPLKIEPVPPAPLHVYAAARSAHAHAGVARWPCPECASLLGGRVFSAECIPAFDWQSVGLFYSFYHSKQPGRITRLLACEDEQLRVHASCPCAQAVPTLCLRLRPSPRLARPRCTRR